MAIARFLARKFALAGRDDIEAAQVDDIVYALQDALNEGFETFLKTRDEIVGVLKFLGLAIPHDNDEEKKKRMMERHLNVTVPTVLGQLEKLLKKRGGQFLVGNTWTWADIQTFFFCSQLVDKEVIKKFPGVNELVRRVGEIPNIKEWMETRPNNPF